MPFIDPWGRYGQGRTVLTAFGLGIALGLGAVLTKLSDNFVDFGLYLIALSIFHLWEYMYVVIFHPDRLSADSFMVNHSVAFNVALVAGWAEYFFEWVYYPSIKGNSLVYLFGFIITMAGQLLRTIAMLTAGHNFSHRIVQKKEDGHVLVRHGVYSVVRHPSYTGWFIWSIAIQVILGNPICTVLYAIASFTFFKRRIPYEEKTLITFFGAQYIAYKKEVPSGIPMVE